MKCLTALGLSILSILPLSSSIFATELNPSTALKGIFDGSKAPAIAPTIYPHTPASKVKTLTGEARSVTPSEALLETMPETSVSAQLSMPKSPEISFIRPAKNTSVSAARRSGSGDVFLNMLTWVGNLTWGLINTLIGLLIILGACIGLLIGYGKLPSFSFSPTGGQIMVNTEPLAWGALSMGIFQIGSPIAHGHETGHARQSALLGPLYVPIVLLSYLFQGHSGSFMENWATQWAP